LAHFKLTAKSRLGLVQSAAIRITDEIRRMTIELELSEPQDAANL